MAKQTKETAPPVSQKQLFNLILNRFNVDRAYIKKRKLVEGWEQSEAMYNNDWWSGSDRPEHLTKATNNSFFEVVETMLPVVTARTPKPDVHALPSSDAVKQYLEAQAEDPEEAAQKWAAYRQQMSSYASGLSREITKAWIMVGMEDKIKKGFREHEIKGTLIIKSVWNKKKKKIEAEVCDPKTIVPYYLADSIEACRDNHLSHAYLKPIRWVSQKYNVPMSKIKADGVLDDNGVLQLYDKGGSNQAPGAVANAVDNVKNWMEGEGLKRGDELTLVIDHYCDGQIHSDELTKEQYQQDVYEGDSGKRIPDPSDSSGFKTKTQDRSRWKDGRKITIVRGIPGRTFNDTKVAYPVFPFFKTANYARAGDFWGTTEVRNIEMQIRMMNMIMSNINDNARLTGNPQKERVIGSEITDVENEPGVVYDTPMPNSLRNINPPVMPAYIRMFLLDLQANIDRITGITDAFRGIAKAGDSGVKVRSLISQGVGRLQPKTMAFVELSRQLYNHWAYIIQAYYPDQIVQRIDDKPGDPRYELFEPNSMPNAIFDIKVSLQAMLPVDDEAEFIEAQALFQAGVETLGYPLISPEHLIELAPSLQDKQRAKEWVASVQKQAQEEAEAEKGGGQSTQQLRDAGATDDDITALENAREANDEDAVRAILSKFMQ